MFLSYLQTDEHFIFLNLKILVTENCLKIKDVLKFESLETCIVYRQEGRLWLARAALKITKIQVFKFRKVKCSSVWRYDKTSVPSDKTVPLTLQPY